MNVLTKAYYREILNCCEVAHSLTQIHQTTKISYPTILKYIEILVNDDHVEEFKFEGDKSRFFQNTSKGNKLRKEVNE